MKALYVILDIALLFTTYGSQYGIMIYICGSDTRGLLVNGDMLGFKGVVSSKSLYVYMEYVCTS